MSETKTFCIEVSFDGIDTDTKLLQSRVDKFITDAMNDNDDLLMTEDERVNGGSISYEVTTEAEYNTASVLEFDSNTGEFGKAFNEGGIENKISIEKSLQGVILKLKHIDPSCKPFDQLTPEEQDQPLKNEAWIAIERITGGWTLDVAASSLDDVDQSQVINDDGSITGR